MKTFQYVTPEDEVITVEARLMSFERGTLFFKNEEDDISLIVREGNWKTATLVTDV